MLPRRLDTDGFVRHDCRLHSRFAGAGQQALREDAMADGVDLQDRLEINDLMMKYAWSFDTGDLDGIVAVFAPDGVIRSSQGERHQGSENVRRYYGKFVAQPHF